MSNPSDTTTTSPPLAAIAANPSAFASFASSAAALAARSAASSRCSRCRGRDRAEADGQGRGPYIRSGTGRSLGENLADAAVYDEDVIRSLDNPVYADGALAVADDAMALAPLTAP